MAAWLARVRDAGGWARYVSGHRYALAVMWELVARGRAGRRDGARRDEQLLDFVFPGLVFLGEAAPGPRLPDELFRVVCAFLGRQY